MKDIVCRAIDGKEEAARAAYIEKECLDTAWSEAQISDIPHYAVYLCAFVNGEMCGIASVYLIAGEAEIMNIAVLPEYRRNGVADALMNKIFSLSRENGCTVATLEVADGNIGAVALYEKHGFKISGRRKGFYKGVDALNMEKTL